MYLEVTIGCEQMTVVYVKTAVIKAKVNVQTRLVRKEG